MSGELIEEPNNCRTPYEGYTLGKTIKMKDSANAPDKRVMYPNIDLLILYGLRG